jgi:hypothetical protein
MSSPLPNIDEEQTVDSSIIASMKQVGILYDSQPIRAACFSPNSAEYFVLGTNSKSLKFCKMTSQILGNIDDDCGKSE